jgi:site-specific DNA-methyltransferase (adenine-specific)
MKTPYYQDNSCTIYHGNCAEILPELPAVDLVLTDPPYGIGYQSNHRAIKHSKIKNDSTLPVDLILLCIEKATRAAYIFCRWDNIPEMPAAQSCLAWVKNNWSMGDLKHEHGRQWEACLFYPKEQHEFIRRIPDVLTIKRTQNNFHPTQKPVPLMEKILAANVGNLILDPFMGSGTTLLAAKNLGRKAIGIELEEKYCEVAANRLRQEVLGF